jgi:hypothetical protein
MMAASIAIAFFLIQAVCPLAIRLADNNEPVVRRSSRNHSIHPLDPRSYETHSSKNITTQHDDRKRVSLRTNQKQDISEELWETYDPAATIVAVSTPPPASTESNVFLHPRKRDNTGGNSGCCSGDSLSLSVHAKCNLPCFG